MYLAVGFTAVFYVNAEEKEYPEISVVDFPAHVHTMHADGDFAFSQEFEVSHKLLLINKFLLL